MNALDTALFEAAKMGASKNVPYLAERGANVNARNESAQLPLQFAANGGHVETCKVLIEAGADVNGLGRQRYTAMHMACSSNVDEAIASSPAIKIIDLLLDHGANVNGKCLSGMTPLHIAARNGFVRVCAHLLDRGADMNPTDIHGKTPLKWAALSGSTPVALLLIARGADPKDAPQKIRNTTIAGLEPWQAAIKGGHVKEVKAFVAVALKARASDNKNKDKDHDDPTVGAMVVYAKKLKNAEMVALIHSDVAMDAIDGLVSRANATSARSQRRR